MSTKELEAAIREIIETEYNCISNKRIVVSESCDDDGPFGYVAKIELTTIDKPISLAMGTTDQDKFLDFIRKEIRYGSYNSVDFYTGYRLEPKETII